MFALAAIRSWMAAGRGSDTMRNSAVLFVGNIATGAFYLVCSLIASRQLGPEDFGRLAVFIAFTATVLGITDLGLGTTVIRLVAGNAVEDPRRAASVARVVVVLELATGVLVGVVGWFSAGLLAGLFGGHELEEVLRFGVVASAMGSASAFVGPLLVARGLYARNALLTSAAAGARLVGLLLLLALGDVTLSSVLLAYTLVVGVFLVLAPLALPRDYFTLEARELDRSSCRQVFDFSKWLFLSFVAAAIAGRMDYFLLARFEGSRSVGLYAAGVQLVSVLGLLVGAVATVLLPVVSRLRSREDFRSYLRKVLPASVACALVLAPTVLIGPPLIELLFGDRFLGAAGAFRLLVASALVTLVVAPVNLVLLALDKPSVLTAVTYAQLAASVALHVVLIPRFGAEGAALTGLITNSAGGLASGWLAWRAVAAIGQGDREST